MKKAKFLSVALAGLVGVSAFVGVGCGGDRTPANNNGNVAGKNESNATVISIYNYDCGYGRGHIEETMKAFADRVKDVSYEDGKTGVYFKTQHTQTNATGTWLLDSLKNSEYDVFFSDNQDPGLIKSTYSAYVKNVNDLVTAKSTDANARRFAEEKSILERMYPEWAEFYQDEDESVYVVPLFVGLATPTYDVALCESKGLYIKEGSTDEAIQLTNNKAEGCLGADGEDGTEDDGLPETYAQFYLWCDAMKDKGVTPMIWSGSNPGMNVTAWTQLWADYEGAEQAKAIYTFDGVTKLTNLIDVDDNGNITELEDIAITPENGYMAMKQKGRYLTAQFAEKVNENRSKWVDDRSYSPAESHTMAQDHYIASTYSKNPIMMLGEKAYWEAEATGTFKDYESRKGGKTDRRFAALPMPKSDRSLIGTGTTLNVSVNGTMLLKNGIEGGRLEAVEDFFMFYNSSEMMGIQNREGAQPRPFSYQISDDVQATMSYFSKDIYRLLHSDDIDVVYGNDRNKFTTANQDYIASLQWGSSSSYSGADVNDTMIFTVMKNYNVTAEQWFKGLYTRWTYKANAAAQSEWDRMVARIN